MSVFMNKDTKIVRQLIPGITALFAVFAVSACGGDKTTSTSTPKLDNVSVPLRADAPDILRAFTRLCSIAAQDGFEAAAASPEAISFKAEVEVKDTERNLKLVSFAGEKRRATVSVDAVKTSCVAFFKADSINTDAMVHINALDGLEGYRGKLQAVKLGDKTQHSGFYNGNMADGRVIVLSASGGAELASVTMLVAKPDDLK